MVEFVFWLLSYIVPYLGLLTVIVFVHEMGHFLVARWNGVAVATFSIGFGPEIWGRNDKNGTRWRLSAIPLGGYVRFEGDMNAASMPDQERIAAYPPAMQDRLFVNKSVLQRMAIVVAGPLANLIFTFVILYALLIGFGQYVMTPRIDEVVEGSVAEEAGMLSNDLIVSVDGYEVRGFSDFQRLINTAPEREVTIVVSRDGDLSTLTMVPQAVEITDRFGNSHRVGQVGVMAEVDPEDITLFRPDPLTAVGMTFSEMIFILDRTADFIGDFFVGRGDVEQLGGPVKVAQVSGEVATLGIIALINLAALLSLNIGLFNLLPIPLLDGGHLLFYIYEFVRGKPLSPGVQETGFRIGLAFIGTLMIFTLFNDIFL